MKKRLISVFLICSGLIGILSAVSCTGIEDTEAPDITPSDTSVPPQLPNIRWMSSEILSSGDIELLVLFPISVNETEENWTDRVIFKIEPDGNNVADSAQTGLFQPENNVWSTVWEDVNPGKNTFYAELIGEDGAPFDPTVVATMSLTVPEGSGGPAVRKISAGYIVSPPVQFADIQVNLEVINFDIVDAIGEEPVTGQGHYIHYFGVEPPTDPDKPALTEEDTYIVTVDSSVIWREVTDGIYSVWVQLVNNDNTPLEPPVVAMAEVMIPPDIEYWFPPPNNELD